MKTIRQKYQGIDGLLTKIRMLDVSTMGSQSGSAGLGSSLG